MGSYVLAPMLLVHCRMVACERPVKGKLAKALLVLMLVCGTFLIFSKTDLTGLGFWEGHGGAAQHRRVGMGARRRHAGRGVRLERCCCCAPPGANILIVIFMLMGLMLFTGVTPADIWYFFSGHAGRMKDPWTGAPMRAQLREARTGPSRPALRLRKKRGGIRRPPGTMSRPSTWMQRPEAARSGRKRRAAIDIVTLAARLTSPY